MVCPQELVQVGNEWVAMKIGPGTKPASFQTGKDILQQNIEAVKMASETPKTVPVTQLPKEAEKVEKKGDSAAPIAILSSLQGLVELSIHVDCGGYTNFDLKCPPLPIDQALAKMESDAQKTVAMMHRIMIEAKRGF